MLSSNEMLAKSKSLAYLPETSTGDALCRGLCSWRSSVGRCRCLCPWPSEWWEMIGIQWNRSKSRRFLIHFSHSKWRSGKKDFLSKQERLLTGFLNYGLVSSYGIQAMPSIDFWRNNWWFWKIYFFNVFFCCAPLAAFIFLSSWTRLHHFHLVFWMRRDSNQQPFDCESSSLPTKPGLHPLGLIYTFRVFFEIEQTCSKS